MLCANRTTDGEAVSVERTTPADIRRAAAEYLFSRSWPKGPEGTMDPAMVERLRDLYALDLYEAKEHTVRQVALITHESKSTVERRLKRARARMKGEAGLDLD